MKFELFVSLRYLMAKRKQAFFSIITIISIISVTIGVMTLITVLGVMSGFENDLKEKILGTNAHIRIFKFDKGIENYPDVSSRIAKITGVMATTPFVYSEAMLSSEAAVSGIVLLGINPETVGQVTNLKQNLIKGNLDNLMHPPQASNLPGIFIGKELAKIFGLSFLDEVTVISPLGEQTPMGMVPKMKKFRIVGIFDSGMYEYDTKWAYIFLPIAQQFFQIGEAVTGIEVKVSDPYEAHTIARDIEKKLGFSFQARDWMEMNKNLFSALRIEKIIMFIVLVLIILVASFGIISILIMVVMEKTSDIAIMKTMGAKASSIMKIFMIDGLVIGIFGTLLGTIGGLSLGKNIQAVANFLEKRFHINVFPPDVYYIDRVPFQINPTDITLIIVITLTVSFLATVFPSWQASRLDPAKALRYG
ncbi:MAG: lipoprotein-releasing ABC transporter permease subunit [Thermodesulfobacteriota bacterium]|nr:MAG: lipoprotein-releasing ABC transporter permease subunit [Thermodesulfobacteriota bacterium]